MCGVAGLYRFDGAPISPGLLDEMRDSLAHRGPDGFGSWIEERIGLAHRRLSIIDLAGGKQPFHRPLSGGAIERPFVGWVVTFNGEIYNYLELRQELIHAGHNFITQSDTEVLLVALQQWGRGALRRFNGQFAFAACERASRRLILARDSMGEKPLYYIHTPKLFAFASELKGLLPALSACGARRTVDYAALNEFLALNYIPAPRTLLADVRVLEAGCGIEVTERGVEHFRWSGLEEEGATQESRGEFAPLFESATALRLRSDVPVGIFLSGGIDSTCVAVAAARSAGVVPTAFVASFGESSFDEAATAEVTACRLGLPFQKIAVQLGNENVSELIRELVRHGDTPLADSSALAVYLLSRETAKHVKVVLSGDGADELFGGYLTYRATALAAKLPWFIRQILAALGPRFEGLVSERGKVSFGEKLARFARGCVLPPGGAHLAWNGMWSSREQCPLLDPTIRQKVGSAEVFCTLATRYGIPLDDPPLRALLLADQHLYLADDILVKADRMSMAHGLEVRPVVLDPRVVSWSRRRAAESFFLGRQGKMPLRQYLAAKAPWYPRASAKQGFSLPIHLWFRTVLKSFAEEVLFRQSAPGAFLFDREYLRSLWEAHQRGERSIGFELWGILILLLWCEEFKVES